MERRRTLGVVVAAMALSLTCGSGCNPWKKQSVRAKPQSADPLSHSVSDVSHAPPEELQNNFKRDFFNQARSQGMWSSEAREIESSLGVVK